MSDQVRETSEGKAPKRHILRAMVIAAAITVPVVSTAACGETCTPRGNSHICN